MAAIEKRVITLLAPVYDDVTGQSPVPVELQRTSDDWLKLVFSSPNGDPIEKEVACVNSLDGCRCDFVRLLRALMVLAEREILIVDIKYQTTSTEGGEPPMATLQVYVCVHRDACSGESLKDFELVLCHLQTESLAITRRSAKSRIEAKKTAMLDATCSSCHVVGCRLHLWQKEEALGPKTSKLNLPDVFQSLMAHMEAEQMEIRDDVTYATRMQHSDHRVLITDLPTNVLQIVVCFMGARDLASVSGVCSLFRHLAYEVVPGLNLVLYEHQRKGLKWMLYRETPSLVRTPLPHPFILPRRPGHTTKLAINLVDQKIVDGVDTTTRDMCGGMFCDEPGLGKTITILALILRTLGQTTCNAASIVEDEVSVGLRSARSRDRSVPAEDLVSSGASLIIVPDPLVEHWKYQIEAHVAPGALRTFIDEGIKDLPSNFELAAYDVVVTSFSRLTREWKLHRPASALEERMPERYGFEGPQRYSDGTVRGAVSSLLTVHWVRAIVDEGHKLGGQTPTHLMRMARILSAERRWVMTGTPTPNTLQSADLRYMHGLLVFLRNKPYGMPDGRAWMKAIARPFEQNEPVGFYRLQNLLSRIMMRHTKESIREILPAPIRHTVYIDPTPSEYAQYNVVAAAVRANLVITNMDPHEPGKLHADSLLNPINRKEALQVVSNLRFACCGGVNSEVVLPDEARLETINMLTEAEADGDNIATVIEYLRRVTLPGMTTECGCCKRKLQLLMIIPCGHLCCADCVEDRFVKVGPICFRCNEVYDPEDFQVLQPGFDFREIDDDNNGNRNGNNRPGRQRNPPGRQHDGNQNRRGQAQRGRGHGRNGQPRAQQARPQDIRPNRHYWTVDASKVFYAATRVRELKKEYASRSVTQGVGHSRRARYVKVIIFSQFTEIIWRTKLAFEQQKIPTANFITRVSPGARMKALKRFRTDPSLNVLLLSEMGSHGLDLSFVTHIFLMEEIWDKSLEQQVISRAHRMGANQAVVVEQLWMRGSVESQMAKVTELEESDASTTRAIHELGPPSRSLKRYRTGSNTLLNVAGKKRKRNRGRSELRKVDTGNKGNFLQRKLDYVLNHLRLLGENVAAEPHEIRFFVVDENEGAIRQAIHIMQTPSSSAITSSSEPMQPRNEDHSQTQTLSNTIAVATAAPQQTRDQSPHGATLSRPPGRLPSTARVSPVPKVTARTVVVGKAQANHSALRTVPAAIVDRQRAMISPATTPLPQQVARTNGGSDPNVIVIDDDTIATRSPSQTLPESTPALRTPGSEPEIIIIDNDSTSESEGNSSSDSDSDASMASSGSSADNEAHFGSDSDDSSESDEELDSALTQLIHVAQRRRYARLASIRGSSESPDEVPSSTSSPTEQKLEPPPTEENNAPYVDDEETETE